jgi:hypothetical protein
VDTQKRTSNGFYRISHKAFFEVGMTAIRRPCFLRLTGARISPASAERRDQAPAVFD